MIARFALLAATLAMLQQPAPFRTQTRLVVLEATVTNHRGMRVTGLTRDAFTVTENGKRQPIVLFGSDDVPVSLGLLIDNSGSMRTTRAKVEAAALDFARASNPQDEMFVLNFADKSRIDVPMTGDVHVLEAGIARVDSIGGTAMRDAIAAGEEYLTMHARRDRKVLVVITDGNDNASVTSLDAIRTAAEQHDIVVYAVGLVADQDPHAGRLHHDLTQLTEATGGLAYFPASVAQIDDVALEMARQIRMQYTIGYTPLNQSLDGTYRTIRVTAKGTEPLTVRTRTGYRAAPLVSSTADTRPGVARGGFDLDPHVSQKGHGMYATDRRHFIKAMTAAGAGALVSGAAGASALQTGSSNGPLKALVFDAYGTLFDVYSVTSLCDQLFPGNGNALATLWRAKQLQYSLLRGMMNRYRDFWNLTQDGLVYAAHSLKLDLTPEKRTRLMDAYLTLAAFPDVKPGLEQLKAKGVRLAILSNGEPKMLASAVKSAGLANLLDAVISVEEVKTFKPSPRVYALVEPHTKVNVRETGFVSSNNWDVNGAGAAGLTTFWIQRTAGEPPEELGYPATHIVHALTDLPALVGG